MSPTTSGALRDATACGKGVAITRGNDTHGLRLLEEVFGRHRERKLRGLLPREVLVPARRPARRRHTFARRHALYGGTLYGGALYGGTLNGGTLYGGTLNGACSPARSTAARSRAALLQTEGVRELIHRSTLLSPSSLDAAVIPAASSDFCVPSGGRLLCTSRRIYFRVASPAVTSVGIFSVYVHFTPRPPHPSAPGSPIHWHLSKTNPTGSPVFTASHMMIRGLGFARESFTLVLVQPPTRFRATRAIVAPNVRTASGAVRGVSMGVRFTVRLFN